MSDKATAAPKTVAAHASPKPAALATMTPDMLALRAHFGPAVIQPAPHDGVLVAADRLRDVAAFVRDGLKYDMLTSETAVDYAGEGFIEVVCHVQRIAGGRPLCFKARVPRDEVAPTLPSLTPIYPSAEFQEDEIYDLFGVRFSDHPDLRRILLWNGFNGWPLRKDWHEASFEQENKPFDSRWPHGHYVRTEERVPWADNVNYPANFDPRIHTSEPDAGLYESLLVDENKSDPCASNQLKTDQLIVNMGPQHPSTHGVLRMVVKLDGETITDLKLVLGYLHRDHEKIGERNTWLHNIPYTDRLDYITGMANELGYVTGVERMMNIKPTERAECLRVIMCELTRIQSHFWSVGFLMNDLGAFYTPMMYVMTEREYILDLFESITGSRMMCNYARFGGVSRDVMPAHVNRMRELVNGRIPSALEEIERFLTDNEILKARTIGVGYMSAERSIAHGLTGPCLRAAGVPYDVRRADPYSLYDQFDFDIPVLYGGDVYDRYRVRLLEVRQSLRILHQALDRLEQTKPGEIFAGRKAYSHRVPAGETYARVETPKGELGFYLVSDGGQNPYRYHIRSSSFINLTSMREMTIGRQIADAVVVLGSLDVVLGEVDR